MNDEQRMKLANDFFDDASKIGWGFDWWYRLTHRIHDYPQEHIDHLVAAGVLEKHCINGTTLYRIVTPKPERKVVKAFYRKYADGWSIRCSAHTFPAMGCVSPAVARERAEHHFTSRHANDTVEWDDPPPKAHITYGLEPDDNYRWSCSRCGISHRGYTRNDVALIAESHIHNNHPNFDVTYGPIPELLRVGCRISFTGRLYDEECPDCHHVLIAHRLNDKVCTVCESVNKET
jgi:hypothetical protein